MAQQVRIRPAAASAPPSAWPKPDAARSQAYLEARSRPAPATLALARAAEALDALPRPAACPWLELLLALDTWNAEQRSGTWRDFALFAWGHTKQITEAEKTGSPTRSAWRISASAPTRPECASAPSVISLPGGEIALGRDA